MSDVKKMTQRELAEERANILLKSLRTRLTKLGIGQTYSLRDSLTEPADLTFSAEGNFLKLVAEHMAHGIFVDMGVGKGHSLSDAFEDKSLSGGASPFRSREAKKWKKPFFAEVTTMSELFALQFGVQGIQAIESAIGDLKVKITI